VTAPRYSPHENAERWVRDHGHVDWHGRTRGDCADIADYKRHWKVNHAV
jgi:hypothetical protein